MPRIIAPREQSEDLIEAVIRNYKRTETFDVYADLRRGRGEEQIGSVAGSGEHWGARPAHGDACYFRSKAAALGAVISYANGYFFSDTGDEPKTLGAYKV